MDIVNPEENNIEKNKEITKFHSNIRRLYKLIDKSSCLLWNHNNHITIGKKKQFDAEENFFNIETTQLGYGEISITSMTQLFNFLMNIDTYLSQEDESLVESYNLTKDSYFLDIGSGFGKPVFHCAYQVGCICQGIEVVPARVEFCVDFYFGFSDGRNDLPEKIINRESKSKYVNRKKKKGKKKRENGIYNSKENIHKKIENVILKKYIDFNQLFKNNSSFRYNWFNIYNYGYNFCINPDFDNLIWSLHEPLIKYENYIDIDNIMHDIYFFLNNYYGKEEYIVNYLTNIFYKVNNRNILLLTNNEIEYYFDEPFPDIKTKILENEKNINMNSKISENIINNLYKSSTNNYIPLIDANDSFYQETYENTYLLDFLNFINENTSIEIHDYIPEQNNINNIISSSNSINNSYQNLISTNKESTNDMIIEEELIKREDENTSNNYLIDFNNPIPETQNNQNILKYLQNKLTFNPHDSQFYKKCSFLCNDATKYDDYHYNPPFDSKKETKHPFTHIYSYNKLMGDTCKEKVCEILNNSDWKVLAWYTNERQTRESGLENFQFVASFPMTSTGNQKFSCYIYIKKYD